MRARKSGRGGVEVRGEGREYRHGSLKVCRPRRGKGSEYPGINKGHGGVSTDQRGF